MKNLEKHGFHYDQDKVGIVTITMDMPGSVNAINDSFREALRETIAILEQQKGLKGVVLTSAKSTFIAGGDVKEMRLADPAHKNEWLEKIQLINDTLRRIEKLPVPVVAAINGAALGGGLEVCLACNHRIIVNSPKAVLGFPEVTLGLFPAGGGVIRSIHMIGLEKTLPLVLEGTTLTPDKAKAVGWVDEIVERIEDLVPAAKAWISANPTASAQPWDIKGHTIPGGDIQNPAIQVLLDMAHASVLKKTQGLLPAPQMVLTMARKTVTASFDATLPIQNSLFLDLIFRPETKNLLTSNFLHINEVKSGTSRPKNIEKTPVKKLGILGAGMMGQGITYAAAMVGIEVVLKDVSLASAEKGKAYTQKLLEKAVKGGRMTEAKKAEILALIKPTENYADMEGCDFMVEAVFENIELKTQVMAEAEPFMDKGGVFSSNTSTLPITMLAKASRHPENYIGTHFFSPVDKMQLVEIICGEKTSDATIARAFDFVQQIRKIPIVVNDGPGFFTSRVFGPYMDEGSWLLEDGVDPVTIESLAKKIGMPVGPLAIHDEVSLMLTRKVVTTLRSLGIYGKEFRVDANCRTTDKLIDEYNRAGRYYGGGYYEYPESGEKHIWPKLYEIYHRPDVSIPDEDIKDRFLFRSVIETLKCLEEGVLRSVADGNIGSLYGIGAPAWTGGYLQFVNTYGLQRFSDRANQLADLYGERFRPPRILAEKIAANELIE